MSHKLVYMCPVCRNRIEYDIGSVTMYTHEKKNIDGNTEWIEGSHPITTPALVTTINPPKCNHVKDSKEYKVQPVSHMIPVPEWVPEIMDSIIRIIPDAHNFEIPTFTIWGENGVDSTCKLTLSFSTNDINAFTRFVEIASILIDEDTRGYASKLKVGVISSRLPDTYCDGNSIEDCSIKIYAPSVNFMSSNSGRGRTFFEFIRHIIIRYSNYEQMKIGGI